MTGIGDTRLGLDAERPADDDDAALGSDPDADTQPIPVVVRRASGGPTLLWIGAGAVLGVGALVLLGGGLGSDRPMPAGPSPSARAPTRAGSPTATTATPAPATLRPVAPSRLAIVLRVGARPGTRVWVEVRREGASGRPLFAGIVDDHGARRFASSKPLWLGVAWAPNLTVTVNGEVIDAEGGTESYLVTATGLERLTSSS